MVVNPKKTWNIIFVILLQQVLFRRFYFQFLHCLLLAQTRITPEVTKARDQYYKEKSKKKYNFKDRKNAQ